MKKFVSLAAAILLASVITSDGTPAEAAGVCGLHDDVTSSLITRYKEKPVSIGVNVDGSVVEVYASTKGSWTILITDTGGITCVLAAGEDWEAIAPNAKGQKT